MLSRLDLESKGQGHSKNLKPMPWGTKNMPARRNLSRGSFSNWCDPDAHADAVADTDTPAGVDIVFAPCRGAGFCDKAQKQCRPRPASSEEGELRSAVFCQVTGVHLMRQIFMNDLLTEQDKQRSRGIR